MNSGGLAVCRRSAQETRSPVDGMIRRTKSYAGTELIAKLGDVQNALNERVKELTCLYRFSALIEKCDNSPAPLDVLFRGTVDILPQAMRHSEIAAARIVHAEREYATPGFAPSPWELTADIVSDGAKCGRVEIRYLAVAGAFEQDPFLPEERALANAIAERLGRCLERINAQNLLRVEQAALRHKDIALGQVLEKMRQEKEEVARQVATNINKIIMPMLGDLERGLSTPQRKCAALLRESLLEITSPFTERLSVRFGNLTPAEVRVCDLVRRGMSCKDIAAAEHVSPGTVRVQRFHIRRKLGLLNKALNLQTFLQSASAQANPSAADLTYDGI